MRNLFEKLISLFDNLSFVENVSEWIIVQNSNSEATMFSNCIIRYPVGICYWIPDNRIQDSWQFYQIPEPDTADHTADDSENE